MRRHGGGEEEEEEYREECEDGKDLKSSLVREESKQNNYSSSEALYKALAVWVAHSLNYKKKISKGRLSTWVEEEERELTVNLSSVSRLD